MTWQKHIPAPVMATLQRSYDDRVAQVPGSEPARVNVPKRATATVCGTEYTAEHVGGNIDNAFWTGPVASFVDAVDKIHISDLNMTVIIYERTVAISTATDPSTPNRLWESIHWIRNFWIGSSAGFKCRYVDRKSQVSLYNSLARACLDIGTSSCDHPGCDTWRELPVGGDDKALHFLIGNNATTVLGEHDTERLDEIHLDWTSPVTSGGGQTCSTLRIHPSSWLTPVKHVAQSIVGFGSPTSPFVFEDLAIDAEARDNRLHRLSPAERARLVELRTTWATNGRLWACQGQAGWNAATPHLQEVEALLAKLR